MGPVESGPRQFVFLSARVVDLLGLPPFLLRAHATASRVKEDDNNNNNQRRTVEQTMLDVPVPLMEEQLLVDVFAPHDIRVLEQVIEVPQILIDELPVANSCSRAAAGGKAGGSADDPLLFPCCSRSWSRTWTFQSRRGGVRGLQGFLPRQGSTTSPLSLSGTHF